MQRLPSRWARAALLVAAGAVACGPPSTLPIPPLVRARVDTLYYDVPGDAPRDWLAAMHRAAPAAGVEPGYHAQVRWLTRWSYESSRPASMGCEAVQPAVEAEIHYLMPRVADTSAALPADRAEWRRYMTSLWAHENGHAVRAMRGAGAQMETLRRLRTPSCAQFAAEARRLLADTVAKYQRLSREYDDRTRHGARQGALLIVDRSRPVAVDTTYRDTLP